MICPNCGAEVENGVNQCILCDYIFETEEIRQVPENISTPMKSYPTTKPMTAEKKKFSVPIIVLISFLIIVVTALCVAIIAMYDKEQNSNKDNDINENVTTLVAETTTNALTEESSIEIETEVVITTNEVVTTLEVLTEIPIIEEANKLVYLDDSGLLRIDHTILDTSFDEFSNLIGAELPKPQDFPYWGIDLKNVDYTYNDIPLCFMFQYDRLVMVIYDQLSDFDYDTYNRACELFGNELDSSSLENYSWDLGDSYYTMVEDVYLETNEYYFKQYYTILMM